jgi:hypothetical protein
MHFNNSNSKPCWPVFRKLSRHTGFIVSYHS